MSCCNSACGLNCNDPLKRSPEVNAANLVAFKQTFPNCYVQEWDNDKLYVSLGDTLEPGTFDATARAILMWFHEHKYQGIDEEGHPFSLAESVAQRPQPSCLVS